MKNILLILFFISIDLTAQNENKSYFKAEENDVIWQKILVIDSDTDRYIENLKLNEFFNSLELNNNSLTGKTNKKDLKIKAPYWASFPFDCYAKIEFKENKSRITFSNITFDGPEIEIYGVKKKLDYKLSELALKNGNLKDNKKTEDVLLILNSFFEDATSPKQIENKSDW